ncbi:hypothetical protein SOVF_175060 [Spinacia oleracea]|nr:hypothetical protein SOVF_175060 [Spinacia oleracea]
MSTDSSANSIPSSIASSDNESVETAESSVIQSSLKTRIQFLVKGSNVDDLGAKYSIDIDGSFNRIYRDYARRTEMRPTDLRLFYQGALITPIETPFGRSFVGNDVVLAQDKNGRGVPVNPTGGIGEFIIFTVVECTTIPATYQYCVKKVDPTRIIFNRVANIREVANNRVRLILDANNVDDRKTFEEAQFYDGAVVHFVLEGIHYDRRRHYDD